MLRVLHDRIPETKRDRLPVSVTALKNKFKKFYESSIEEREYYFYSKAELVRLIQEKRLRLPANASISTLIKALADKDRGYNSNSTISRGRRSSSSSTQDDDQEETTEQKVIRSILQKSFQPHQKGKLREYCSIGHKLELPILSNWC